MPKRKSDEDSDEYIRRKMRKIEKKLRRRKKRSRRLSSSSNDLESICASPVLSLPEVAAQEANYIVNLEYPVAQTMYNCDNVLAQ
ncbi:jg17778 [Pararge aegeria aegeria]|uniref:Jg17778 protein n=1 Tax=Pararge aegeria aegeria TaxID=348720 RepID=A0A8S4R942_9NEOP|nr:jg17778 [Pararge aegeria aegeria]